MNSTEPSTVLKVLRNFLLFVFDPPPLPPHCTLLNRVSWFINQKMFKQLIISIVNTTIEASPTLRFIRQHSWLANNWRHPTLYRVNCYSISRIDAAKPATRLQSLTSRSIVRTVRLYKMLTLWLRFLRWKNLCSVTHYQNPILSDLDFNPSPAEMHQIFFRLWAVKFLWKIRKIPITTTFGCALHDRVV